MERTELVLTRVEAGAPAVLLRRPVVAPVVNNQPKPLGRQRKPGWRILSSALLIGVLGGIAAGLIGTGGSVSKPSRPSAPVTLPAAPEKGVPDIAEMKDTAAPLPAAKDAELSRLKARNRRLEALISVLRERKGSHGKPMVAAR